MDQYGIVRLDSRDDGMRFLFSDGNEQEIEWNAPVAVSLTDVIVDPVGAVPCGFSKVGGNPPTYARLGTFLAHRLVEKVWILTPDGMRKVVRIER